MATSAYPPLRHRARKFAAAAPGADTNILNPSIQPDYPFSTFRVTVALAGASVFQVTVNDGATTKTCKFNAGAQLAAGCLYTFDFGVAHKVDLPAMGAPSGDDARDLYYNFQVATDVAIDLLIVDEIPGGVL